MNKQEILDLIRSESLSLQDKLDVVESLYEDEPIKSLYIPGYWTPDKDEKYYSIFPTDWDDPKEICTIVDQTWECLNMEQHYRLLGLIFKTRKEAEAKLIQLKAYQKLVKAIALENQRTGFFLQHLPTQQDAYYFWINTKKEVQSGFGRYRLPSIEFFGNSSIQPLQSKLGNLLIRNALELNLEKVIDE